MMEIIKAFGDMIITLPVSRVIIGKNAGFLVSSSFLAKFTQAMADIQKAFFK
tara:strand:- start:155 stop:310 length:156 start_codon:yes stop_codon:yes gene_type:complete